jgi:hypothetical protein
MRFCERHNSMIFHASRPGAAPCRKAWLQTSVSWVCAHYTRPALCLQVGSYCDPSVEMAVAVLLLRLTFVAVLSFAIGWVTGHVCEALGARCEAGSIPAEREAGPDGGRGDGRDRGGSCDGPVRRRSIHRAVDGKGLGGEATAIPSAFGHRSSVGDGGGGLGGRCAVCRDQVATVGFQHRTRVHCCLCRGCWLELKWRGMTSRCPLCNQPGPCIEVIST